MERKNQIRIGKLLRYIGLSCVGILGFMTIVGTSGGIYGAPDLNFPPSITNAITTDAAFNPQVVFTIGDTVNYLLTAWDVDRDMTQVIVEQYYPPGTSFSPYYGPDTLNLPSQSANTMTYNLLSGVTIAGPAGQWRVDFQVVDSTGLESNVFQVYIQVNP